MIALVSLIGLFFYTVLTVVLMYFAVRIAKHYKHPGWQGALPVFILMYLLIAWDQIPTYLVHQYYCKNWAGFYEYKTVEQWKKEHPGEEKGLSCKINTDTYRNHDGDFVLILNQRFHNVVSNKKLPMLPVWLEEDKVVDMVTHEVT